jgi:tRNA(adenine34) deaminase
MAMNHEMFMQMALEQAQKALDHDQLPIGAVVVLNNKVIGSGFNCIKEKSDFLAHAEMEAIESAKENIRKLKIQERRSCVLYWPCLDLVDKCWVIV